MKQAASAACLAGVGPRPASPGGAGGTAPRGQKDLCAVYTYPWPMNRASPELGEARFMDRQV